MRSCFTFSRLFIEVRPLTGIIGTRCVRRATNAKKSIRYLRHTIQLYDTVIQYCYTILLYNTIIFEIFLKLACQNEIESELSLKSTFS